MATPRITIITITYNAANCLIPTMESVAAQTFRDFEHIIIDGASTDETVAIARSLGGRACRILSERDKGLYDAMNKGLDMARGDYLLFLNAGDAFHDSDTLAKYAAATQLPDGHDADIVYGDTVLVNEGREVIGKRHLSVPDVLTYGSFSHGMLVCHQAFMVRRRLAPHYDITYRFSADYDWTLRCLRVSMPEKCVNLHCVAIDYLTDGLTDKNHKASLMERFRIMRNHFGTATAVWRHLSFIPRAIGRKFAGK